MKRGAVIKFVKDNWLLILIITAGLFVRIYQFGEIPPGLNQDEASIGYDSYAIAHYGIDRNSFHNPVHFKSWGSGQNALYGYLSIPFIWLFGLNVLSVRLVNLLFGLISILVFYLFVKEISNKSTAFVAAFLLLICPWHIMLSRWALESNIFPIFFLLGALFLVYSTKKQIYFPISFAFFALSLYAYNVAFFVVPLFVLGSSIYLLTHHKIKLRIFLLSSLVFLLLSAPIILFVIINTYSLNTIDAHYFSIPLVNGARFKTASTLFGANVFDSIIPNIKRLLYDIILNQNDGIIRNQIPPYGIVYVLSMPLAFLGLLITFAENKSLKRLNKSFLMLLWFLLSICLAAFIEVNINRINILFLPLLYFTAVGIIYVRDKISRGLFFFIIVLYLVCFASFAHYYFAYYDERASSEFFESFGDAINYAADNTNGTICVSGGVNMPYIFVLFYRQIDPHIFLSTVKYSNGGEFQGVSSFDRYIFSGLEECKSRKDNPALIFHNSESNKISTSDYAIKSFKRYSVAISKGVAK